MYKKEYYREYYEARKERCRDHYYEKKQKKIENEILFQEFGSEAEYYKIKYKEYINAARKGTES